MPEERQDYWFIIHSKPKKEFVAEKNLNFQGIHAYLPIYSKKVRKNKEKVEQITPLFTGYLFAQFPVEDQYHHVRYTKGVKSILGTDDFLWIISDEKIRDIRSREKDGVVVLNKKSISFFRGDSILVDDGDFEGWEGIFQEELPDHERAVILLTNIQYSSKLVIPIHFLCRNDGKKR